MKTEKEKELHKAYHRMYSAQARANKKKYGSNRKPLYVMPSTDKVIDDACFVFQVQKQSVLSKDRYPDLVKARRAAMYIMKDKMRMGWVEISRVFKCHHTSVIHHVETARDYIETNVYFKKDIETLERIFVFEYARLNPTLITS